MSLMTKQIAEEVSKVSKDFSISNVRLVGMHDADNKLMLALDEDDFTVYAHMIADFAGDPPENYRVLNSIVMDKVTGMLGVLTKELSSPLQKFIMDEYADVADITDVMEEGLDDFIWESQVDYMAMLDVESSHVYFDIELVLEMEKTE